MRYRTICGLLIVTACGGDENRLATSARCSGACEVRLDTLVELAASRDSVWPSVLARALRTPSGHYVVGGTDHPGEVAIYSSEGMLLRTLGQAGEGPYEFPSNYLAPVVTADGRVRIVDLLGAVSIELNHALQPIDYTRLPFRPQQVSAMGDRLILQSPIRAADGTRYMLHSVGDNGSVDSFFPQEYVRTESDNFLALGIGDDHTLWISARDAYRPILLDSSFSTVREVNPRQAWIGQGDDASDAVLLGMLERDSLLWVVLRVPDAAYEPPLRPQPLATSEIAKKYRYILEAVDLESGERIASLTLRELLAVGAGDGLVYGLSEAQDGRTTVRAYRPLVH